MNEAAIWSPEEMASIWDFYVAKSVANSASQKRGARDYGLKQLPFETLLEYAGVAAERYEIVMANRVDGILRQYGFKYMVKQGVEQEIDISIPRMVCIQPYSITDREGPKEKAGKGETLLTHVRNSLAHGCTYFFDNGMMLLEDRQTGISGATTAMILIPQSAFLDWIKIIDINAQHYFKESDRSVFEKLVTKAKTKNCVKDANSPGSFHSA